MDRKRPPEAHCGARPCSYDGLIPEGPRQGRVGSQDGCRKEEGEGQRETGETVKPPCLRSKAICREMIPSLQIPACSCAHTSLELQRRTRSCKGEHGGAARGQGQRSQALTAAPIQQGATLPPPSHRRAAWLFSIPDSHSGPPGARLHYPRPLHRQKAQALKGLPWDHTARRR